jgi:hypothetical protein
MNAIRNGVKICAECRFYAEDGRCFHPDSMMVDRVTGTKWKTARERRAVSDFSRDTDPCGFDGKQWQGGRPNEDLGGCIGILFALAIVAVAVGVYMAIWG